MRFNVNVEMIETAGDNRALVFAVLIAIYIYIYIYIYISHLTQERYNVDIGEHNGYVGYGMVVSNVCSFSSRNVKTINTADQNKGHIYTHWSKEMPHKYVQKLWIENANVLKSDFFTAMFLNIWTLLISD